MIPHAKIPGRVMLGEPKPDDSFVDNTVYRYKMINGEKVLIGTQDPFPEGWFDPEGWRRTKTGEEENDMGKQREIPTYPELLKAFQESGYKIAPVKREFKIHWNTAQRWLFDAGLIDENGKPTDKAKPKQMFSKEEATPMETAIEETSKGEEVLDSIDAGKKPKATDEKCRNCGRTIPGDEVKYWHRGWMCNECAGSVLDASLKPDEAVKAESHDHHISAEPSDASQDELAPCETGHAMPDAQTLVCEPAGSQYEPEDNDYQDEPDKAMSPAGGINFNRKAFVIQMIEATMENARNAKAPADLTLEIIDAILVVA